MFVVILKSNKGRKFRRSCSGFTLIETLISLPIAAIVLIALYACFTQGFNMAQQSREHLCATQIMLQHLERIRVCPFDQLTNTVYNPRTLTNYFDAADQPTGGGGAAYTVTFTPSVPASGLLPDSYRPTMLLITDGISWTSRKLQYTNFMQTLVARNGIQSYVVVGK